MHTYTVVGSTGFIGKNLLHFLKERGENVLEVNRTLPNKNVSLGTVVYCAGFGGCNEPQKVIDANLNFLLELLNTCSYERIFYISSSRLYLGSANGAENASLIISTDDKRSLFNLSKLTAEKLSIDNSKFVSLRVSNVYGDAFKSPLFLPTIIRDALKNKKIKMFTSKEYAKDYINVFDVCSAIYLLSKKNVLSHDLYNIACSENVSADDILNEIAKHIDFSVDWLTTGVDEIFPVISTERLRSEIDFKPSSVIDDISHITNLFKANIDKL
jgi:nucleoside-diphosphate-sugar epimerase